LVEGGSIVKTQWLFGLVLAGFAAGVTAEAAAQSTDIAYGTAPRANYVVFVDGSGRISPVASDTVHMAADAAKWARTVNVVGPRVYAEAVKSQLVKDGVPAPAIVVTPKTHAPLPVAADGMSDPAKRRVEITF
jgi:hypothetical protein